MSDSKPTTKAAGPRRGWRKWLIDIGLIAAVFLGITAWQTRNLLPTSGEEAPGFELVDLDGNTVRLSDFEGQAVQLHFWGTWCPVCRREHGALNSVSASRGGNTAMVAIAVDSGTVEEIRAYVEEKGITYPVLIDTGRTARDYRVNVFPTNYYLDPSHRIISRDVGMSTRWSMRVKLWRASRRAA